MFDKLRSWFGRMQPIRPGAELDDRRDAFRSAVALARQRELAARPLFDQLQFALRTAESPVPIDRATIPLDLALGPSRIKEMAAQIKLSVYLKFNITALLDHYRDNQQELKKAERAAELLEKNSEIQVQAEALEIIHGLYRNLLASREMFRDYPLFYDMFATLPFEPADEAEPARGGARSTVPEDLNHLLSDEAPTGVGGEFLQGEDEEDLLHPEAMLTTLSVTSVELDLGMDLINLVDPALGGDMMSRIGPMRADIAQDLGFICPGVRISDNVELRPNAYVIRVRGHAVAEGELVLGYHLAVESPHADAMPPQIAGFATRDPVTRRPAIWVPRAAGTRLRNLGYTVLECNELLARHLEATIRRHAHEMFAMEELTVMLDFLRERHPQTIEAVLAEKLELCDYHQILKNLLREQVSIRDQLTILETLAVAAKPVHPFYLANQFGPNRATVENLMLMEMAAQIRPLNDPLVLTELVRKALSRQLCAAVANPDQVIDVILLDASVEGALLDGIQTGTLGQTLSLSSSQRDLLTSRLVVQCGHLDQPVVLCDPRIRPFMRDLCQRELPHLTVLSFAEIHPQYQAQGIGTVSLIGS
ncbi:MAG: FHIPEP family type III secretion protein [Candidatus Sericytochromatia bacterium]|nr:FHIPEP family type III secretion protein [Candidatus Sericytochromatia bacterium]